MSEIISPPRLKVQATIPSAPSSVAEFVENNTERYNAAFQQIDIRHSGIGFNSWAALGGSLWAAWRGIWWASYLLAGIDLLFLVEIWRGWQAQPTLEAIFLWVSLLILVHLGFGAVADRAYRLQYRRWRFHASTPSGTSFGRLVATFALLAPAYALVIYRFTASEPSGIWIEFPALTDFTNATTTAINDFVSWMTGAFGPFFDTLTALLRTTLNAIEVIVVETPWPVVTGVIVLAAYKRGGSRLAIFTAAALAYLGLFGLWDKSMATIALVVTSVLVCLIIGLPLGLICAKNNRVNAVFEPLLDVMQTLPTFVYLIPAIAFFSIGKPPGLIATVIFALPPVIRLTALGIRQVPGNVREAADAFGATPMQMLLKVELPLATSSIRLGINQTIMMSLSMVVIAAMIGAGGLGQEVIRSLQYLQTGQGFLAGFAIVLVAMVLDRMVHRR